MESSNKRKVPEDERTAGEGALLNNPLGEPEPKRQKRADSPSPAIAPADQQQPNATTKPTTESDKPHNVRSAPISGPGPGQAREVAPRKPRKWTAEYFQNLYTKDPSFKYLGQKDPEFAKLYVTFGVIVSSSSSSTETAPIINTLSSYEKSRLQKPTRLH